MEGLNITSAQYVIDKFSGQNTSIKMIVDDQIYFVALDPANRHYAEIMRQVEAGELTIQEADTI